MIPTTGQRHTQKIFGAVDLYAEGFYYHQDQVFNALTYMAFLEQLAGHYPDREVFVIQDNAAYHKAPEVRAWLAHRAPPVPPGSLARLFTGIQRGRENLAPHTRQRHA
jgi:hypothetical protein